MSNDNNDLDRLCINTIRTLSIDAIEKANSGHPGLPLGAAPMAYCLWRYHLKHAPSAPQWKDRDRFILSAGHGSMLLYSLLHLSGYPLTLDDLRAFRQWGSKTPGHPEFGWTPGVEATTGPLGQGSANAVGMAVAERILAHIFNRPGFTLIDHYTYALVSDGDLMEGVAAEAASLAGHLGLGKLIYLYDSNDITLDGPTSLTFSREDIAKRYEAYGWQVLHVKNGDTDLDEINRAIKLAKTNTQQPTLILVKTTIGYGSPKQGTSSVHGSPLKGEEIRRTKKTLGWEFLDPFFVPPQAAEHFKKSRKIGELEEKNWQTIWDRYQSQFPELAQLWKESWDGNHPNTRLTHLPEFSPQEPLATREASGKIIQALAAQLPTLIGGDADLSCSTNTLIKEGGTFDGKTGAGRNIHYGVREHAMAAISVGIAYHGGLKNFVSTFFCFSDYMRPSIRLAAMNHLPIICVWTHDSIALGEDGPTHQPVEHLMALRTIPNLLVIRPCDANETREAWKVAISQKNRPVGLVLTRQKVPTLDRTVLAPASDLQKGAYILSEAKGEEPRVILIASGSEVELALQVQQALESLNIHSRVVSMPSWELFVEQPLEYQEATLPKRGVLKVSIEAGVTLGWQKWIGDDGIAVGVDRFGASAPASVLLREFGLTAENIVDRVLKSLKEKK